MSATEIELLRTEILLLKAENEKLRADAKRYRWLRDHSVHKGSHGERFIEFNCDFENWNDVDAAIDAAMKGNQ